MLLLILIATVSYILGSIPSGYLAGRIAGVDIRTVGSGNIGATNVTRVLGKRYGYSVFAADFGKGFCAVLMAKLASGQFFETNNSLSFAPFVAGLFCVIGNAFPIWLRFRGGKGVATSAGVLFALMPLAALVVTIIWFVIFQATGYVSLASVIAATALPLTVLVMLRFGWMTESLLLYIAIGLTALVILRHRSNLVRLVRGTEQGFRRRGD
jgi:acyl phosphate:glycerol-3-phosphate acyltransferase